MNADLDYLYAHHAVGLCPEERCVTARANLAALVELVGELAQEYHHSGLISHHADPEDKTGWYVKGIETCADPLCVESLAALQGRVASREGSGT